MERRLHIRLFRSVCFLFVFSLVACVKVEVNPEDVVSDVVDAGKEAYQAIKIKQSGAEKRTFKLSLPLVSMDELSSTSSACLLHLKEQIQDASKRRPEYLSESTAVVETDKGRAVECTIDAVI